jgi:hypothetical protein
MKTCNIQKLLRHRPATFICFLKMVARSTFHLYQNYFVFFCRTTTMDPTHQKNLRKFLKKYRHIQQLENPGERAVRALCMGLDHLVHFLKRDVLFKEYSAAAVRWISLIEVIFISLSKETRTFSFELSCRKSNLKYR